MRAVLFAALASTLALAACGQSSEPAGAAGSTGAAEVEPVPTGPELSGVGTLSSVDGRVAVIDHEAVEGGLAEAPLEPGARVAFKYQAAEPMPVLTELSAR